MQLTNIDARLVFENSKMALNKAFPQPLDPVSGRPTRPQASELCKLTQSYLRLEQPLSATRTVYEFPVLVNQTQLGIFNTERRLNMQDSFIISSLGIYLGAPTSATDTTFLLDTYPDPVTYGANAVPMQAVYSGALNITVNGDVLMPSWDVARHYMAPQTQATAAPGAGSPINEKALGSDGRYPMEPNIVLIGSKNSIIKIELPTAPSQVLANSRLIIVPYGVLAQNSTVVS